MADPMSTERLEEFAANAPKAEHGKLWSLLDWSFWGAGMADTFREPLANTMLAATPDDVRAQAEAIMADFIRRREIEKTGVTIYQEQREELDRLREVMQWLQIRADVEHEDTYCGTGPDKCRGCWLARTLVAAKEAVRERRDGGEQS